MYLSEIKSTPGFEDINPADYTESFVPYLYLDGHRSSNIGTTDIDRYKSGLLFFQRFSKIMAEMGFGNMVTMVHTSRNCKSSERIKSIHKAIEENFNYLNQSLNSNFNLYGDLESYNEIGHKDFYNFINKIQIKSPEAGSFNNHILINYSENWALNNLDKINLIPQVSSVIRFTKGYISGGWIPTKMQETTFIYSQIPSISEFWSDEAITALIFVALKNWSRIVKYIGKKEYSSGEKELIHTIRDVELKFSKYKLNIKSSAQNRIIAFGVDGPVSYEL